MTASSQLTSAHHALMHQQSIAQLERELRLYRARIDNPHDPLGLRRDWIHEYHKIKHKLRELR